MRTVLNQINTPLDALETKLHLILNNFSTLVTKDEVTKMADCIKTLTAKVKHVSGKLQELEFRLIAVEESVGH